MLNDLVEDLIDSVCHIFRHYPVNVANKGDKSVFFMVLWRTSLISFPSGINFVIDLRSIASIRDRFSFCHRDTWKGIVMDLFSVANINFSFVDKLFFWYKDETQK